MPNKICWIDSIDYNDADATLKTVYDSVKSPHHRLDNLYRAFSLRPHTIKPADDLYRAVLHHDGNSLTKTFAELIGSYVAILTGCDYALTHHGHNFTQLLGDPERAAVVLQQLRDGRLEHCGNAQEVSALRYVNKLCLTPERMTAADVQALTDQGWSDGEVLEIAQIVAMFSYFVRVINGVGISLHGDRIGLY